MPKFYHLVMSDGANFARISSRVPQRGYQWGCDMSGKYSAEWWEKVSRNRQITQVNMSPSLAPAAEPDRTDPEAPAPAAPSEPDEVPQTDTAGADVQETPEG